MANLSLRELHRELEARGVQIKYEALSELIKRGDVAQQLEVGGGANRREFPLKTIDTLAVFIPAFQAQTLIKNEGIPDALRSFMKRGVGALLPSGVGGMDLVRQIASTPEPPDAIAVAEAQGRAQGLAMADEVFTPQEAAKFLRTTVRQLRKYGPTPFRRVGLSKEGDRWRKSDLVDES